MALARATVTALLEEASRGLMGHRRLVPAALARPVSGPVDPEDRSRR